LLLKIVTLLDEGLGIEYGVQKIENYFAYIKSHYFKLTVLLSKFRLDLLIIE